MRNKVIFLLTCLLNLVFTLGQTVYREGEIVPLYYNKLFSLKNPLTYSIDVLPFLCPTPSPRKKTFLVFDQDLRGDRPFQSDIQVKMLQNQECQLLCKKSLGVKHAIQLSEWIKDEYQVEWELDGMPGATVSYTNEIPEHNYRIGFPLGFRIGNLYYLNNHVVIQILYEKRNHDQYRIQGFEVYPDSIARGECSKKTVDYQHQKVLEQRFTVSSTYSIRWKQVNSVRSSRWDRFLVDPRSDRHRLGFMNALIVSLVLSSLVLFILHKARRQRTSSGQEDKELKVYEDMEDYVGWRLIDRDVFRRPVYGGLLPPLVGTGVQLILVAVGLLFALYRKWYHPAQPMTLTQWFVSLFLLGSLPGGYTSAKLYKVFRGKSWILNSLLTATLVPFLVLMILFVLTFFTWSQQSTLAISLTGWIIMFSIVLALVPLTFLGAFLGERSDRIEYPTRTTQLPRMIPKKQWFQHPLLRAALTGIIPFSTLYLNWHELLSSITKGEYVLSIEYTLQISAGFLISSSAVTMISVFLQLCTEDYLWWWQSLALGASSVVYMWIYGLFYFFQHSPIQSTIGCFVYITQLTLGCAVLALCTGTLGFICTYFFLRHIYSSVKID